MAPSTATLQEASWRDGESLLVLTVQDRIVADSRISVLIPSSFALRFPSAGFRADGSISLSIVAAWGHLKAVGSLLAQKVSVPLDQALVNSTLQLLPPQTSPPPHILLRVALQPVKGNGTVALLLRLPWQCTSCPSANGAVAAAQATGGANITGIFSFDDYHGGAGAGQGTFFRKPPEYVQCQGYTDANETAANVTLLRVDLQYRLRSMSLPAVLSLKIFSGAVLIDPRGIRMGSEELFTWQLFALTPHAEDFLALIPGSHPKVAYPSTRHAATVGSTIPGSMTNLGVSGCDSWNPCHACAGDCDDDSDCATGLKCYQRDGNLSSDIPGCPKISLVDGWDYCYEPGNLPAYDTQGGPLGQGHVSFDRTQTQYLDGGARTFKIASKGGFTVVAVVRFKGSPGYDERIIDFGNGANNNNILLGRQGNSNDMLFQVWQGGSSSCAVTISSAIVQHRWMTVVAQYLSHKCMLRVIVEGYGVSSSWSPGLSTPVTDRTVSKAWVGRNHWGQSWLNADIAGLYANDEYVNDNNADLIADKLKAGLDMTLLASPITLPSVLGHVQAVGTVLQSRLEFSPNGAGMKTQITLSFSLSMTVAEGETLSLALPGFFMPPDSTGIIELSTNSSDYTATYDDTSSTLHLTARSTLAPTHTHLVVIAREQGLSLPHLGISAQDVRAFKFRGAARDGVLAPRSLDHVDMVSAFLNSTLAFSNNSFAGFASGLHLNVSLSRPILQGDSIALFLPGFTLGNATHVSKFSWTPYPPSATSGAGAACYDTCNQPLALINCNESDASCQTSQASFDEVPMHTNFVAEVQTVPSALLNLTQGTVTRVAYVKCLFPKALS